MVSTEQSSILRGPQPTVLSYTYKHFTLKMIILNGIAKYAE